MNNKYITISQINQYLKMLFDTNEHLQKIYLKGEISNFKRHSSGHLYLTLKDDASRINAVMFKSSAAKLTFNPEDGQNVLVEGRVSVYPAGGNYQVYIDKMMVDGLGNLYVEFEKLKQKLHAEGLFATSHKRPLPKFPMKIGIITAPTGAAIKDIISTIKRRFPICETILFPSLVQGAQAKDDIVKNIIQAQDYDLDLLIVGRGGGSIEDLWAFNEEKVARAIYNSKIPVISAVGHEIDYTIADYVADKRAPTPTGAAEMATPTTEEVKTLFKEKEQKINHLFYQKLQDLNHTINKLKESFVLKNPMILYETKMQKLDLLTENLQKSIQNFLTIKQEALNTWQKSYLLTNPMILYQKEQNEISQYKQVLAKNMQMILLKKQNDLQFFLQTVKLVNPLNILEKGYSITKKDGQIIKDSSKLKINDTLQISFSKGSVKTVVKEIYHD